MNNEEVLFWSIGKVKVQNRVHALQHKLVIAKCSGDHQAQTEIEVELTTALELLGVLETELYQQKKVA